jgi:membrane protease YdiL (CAAX protease family)
MTPLREVLLVFAAVTAGTAVLGALRGVPYAGDLVHLGVAALFLGGALRLARREPDGARRFGIDLAGILEPIAEDDTRPAGPLGLYDLGRSLRAALPSALRETGFALALCAIIFPPFIAGFWLWYRPAHGYSWQWPPDLASFALTQVVLVGLPEEAFFRGYVQTRLGDHFTARTKLLGTEVSVPALVIQAALFAIVHLATEMNVEKLAIFFPGLAFGWIRARRGGIGASIAFHAACNIIAEILTYGWL